MKQNFRTVLSFLTVIAMLVSTVFSSVVFADGEGMDFTVFLDDIAVGNSVPAGPIAETNNTVTLNKGSGGEDTLLVNSKSATVGGKTYSGYKTAGSRNNDICTGAVTKIADLPDGNCAIFKAPDDGIFVTYLNAGNGVNIWEYDDSGDITDSRPASPHFPGEITTSVALKVQKDYTYVVTTTTSTNNFFLAGFQFLQDNPVTVNLTITGSGSMEIQFIDNATGLEETRVAPTETSVTLTKNHTYTLRSSSIDYKVTTADDKTEFDCDGSAVSLKITATAGRTVTGEITSSHKGKTPDVTGLSFKSMDYPDAAAYAFGADAITGSSYSVSLIPGNYETSITTGSGNWETYDHVLVTETGSVTNEIYAEYIGSDVDYVVPGTYYVWEQHEKSNSLFTFAGTVNQNNDSAKTARLNNGATITFDVNDAVEISVKGWYSGKWKINDGNEYEISGNNSEGTGGEDAPVGNSYTTSGAETITITATSDNTYLTQIEVKSLTPSFESEISVPGDYDTLTEAITAIKGMTRPKDETGRVTITLTDDLEEWVLIDADYVTINGGTGEGHTIQWYYGLVGKYYSQDANGNYSERLFRDKYNKNGGVSGRWGGVVVITGNYFKAENVTFKNTYNYEVTAKEIEDGAEGTQSIPGLRKLSDDVQAYAAKERSNAVLLSNSNFGEFYNCKILSSQDTLGMNGESDTVNYFRDCVIGGNVDYICGAGTLIFDDCTLQWKTYSDAGHNSEIGYIVAPKSKPYIFRNCEVTKDDTAPANDTVLGLFGRTWGADSKAYFINTETNGLVAGWGEMSKGDGASSVFYEYGTTGNNGITNSKDEGFGNRIKTIEDLEPISKDNMSSILKDWEPSNYASEYDYSAEDFNLFHLGDMTGSGSVGDEDIEELIKKILNMDYPTGVEGEDGIAVDVGDIDKDGILTASDAAALRLKLQENK